LDKNPSLFFSEDELALLQQRREADPVGRQLLCNLMAAAEWCRKQPAPAEPDPGPAQVLKDPPLRPDESFYRDDYLITHEAFDLLSLSCERVLPQLSLAYRLTREESWADRAIEWLDAVGNEWESWHPAATGQDSFAVKIMAFTAVACDWLADAVPTALLSRCRDRVVENLHLCMREWRGSLDQSEPNQLNNHYWFNVGLTGIAALWASQWDSGWRDVADRCGRRIARLCDWAIGPDGDHIDKSQYTMYGFRYALPMLVAWEHAGGPDVLSKPRLGAAAAWLADMFDRGDRTEVFERCQIISSWVFMLLASRHRLEHIQWFALQLTDAPALRHQLFIAPWTRTDAVWSYLFYDESLPATPPTVNGPSSPRWYRSSGWVVMEADSTIDTPTVHFYAGPASGKNFYNQGQLHVSAYGHRLLQTPELPHDGYISVHRAYAYLMNNLSGAVLQVDGLGQAKGRYPDEWPGNADIGHPVTPPIAHITRVDCGEEWQLAVADLTDPYRDFALDVDRRGRPLAVPSEWQGKRRDRLLQFTRSIMLVAGEWIVLQDDLTSHPGHSVDLEWHFSTHAVIDIPQPGQATLEMGRAAMDVYAIEPASAELFSQQAHYSETGKFLSIRRDRVEGQIRLLLVMHLRRRGDVPVEPVRDGAVIRLSPDHAVAMGLHGQVPEAL